MTSAHNSNRKKEHIVVSPKTKHLLETERDKLKLDSVEKVIQHLFEIKTEARIVCLYFVQEHDKFLSFLEKHQFIGDVAKNIISKDKEEVK